MAASRSASTAVSTVSSARASVRRRRVDEGLRVRLAADLEALFLAQGFIGLTVDDIAQRVRCSKSTLYSLAATKEQLVVSITKRFFREATSAIEAAVDEVSDPRQRISTYLAGVGTAMERCAPVFYADMNEFEPTAAIYRSNSKAAARRVEELITAGIEAKALRAVNGAFAADLIALAIEGVQSGVLLRRTGLSAGQAYIEIADLLFGGLSEPRRASRRQPQR